MHGWDPSFLDTWRNSPLLWEFSISVKNKEWGNCHISKHSRKMVLESFFLPHHLQWLVLPSLILVGSSCNQSCSTSLLYPQAPFSTSNSSDSTPSTWHLWHRCPKLPPFLHLVTLISTRHSRWSHLHVHTLLCWKFYEVTSQLLISDFYRKNITPNFWTPPGTISCL